MEYQRHDRRPRIESPALHLGRAGAPAGLGQVLGLALGRGVRAGSLDAVWYQLPGAEMYELQTSLGPATETSWIRHATAAGYWATLTGLTSGTKIWVRVRALGAQGVVGPWSKPAAMIVP